MRRILILTAAAGLAAAKLIRPIRAEAWFSKTHKSITQHALELLEKENKTKAAAFYKQHADLLVKGSVDPDNEGDADKGPGAHYYSCATPKGKALPIKGGYYQNRLGEFRKSARTSLEDNYSCALYLYKNNKLPEAVYALGRAVHFVEDISCPVHTANIKYKKSPKNAHDAFETHANTVSAKITAGEYDKRLTKAYSSDSFEQPLNKLCGLSNKHASGISKLDESAFATAENEMIPIAVQNAAAIMLKFYSDCKSGSAEYLTDGKAFALKNEAVGKLLTASDKCVALQKSDKNSEQRFVLEMSDSGAFAVKAKAGYLSASLNGYEEKADEAQFRFTSLGGGRYRISAGGEKFPKVLGVSRSGAPILADFDPTDKSQIWIISR